MILQSNYFTTVALGTDESARCGEVPVTGRRGCNMLLILA